MSPLATAAGLVDHFFSRYCRHLRYPDLGTQLGAKARVLVPENLKQMIKSEIDALNRLYD